AADDALAALTDLTAGTPVVGGAPADADLLTAVARAAAGGVAGGAVVVVEGEVGAGRTRDRDTEAVDESAPRAPVAIQVDEVRAHVLAEEAHRRERRGRPRQLQNAP